MTAYLVPGSPYMTFQYTKATPSLKSMHGGIRSFNGQTLAVGGTSRFPLHLSHPIPSPFTTPLLRRAFCLCSVFTTNMQRVQPAHNSP